MRGACDIDLIVHGNRYRGGTAVAESACIAVACIVTALIVIPLSPSEAEPSSRDLGGGSVIEPNLGDQSCRK